MWQPAPLPYKELPGLSARLLREHHKLYEKYLERLDGVFHRLAQWTDEDGDEFDFNRLLAEEGFLRNAVRLHELYFENMTPGGSESPEHALGDEAGPVVDAMRRAALASTGWVVLAADLHHGDRFVFTMKDHITGFPVGAWPLLVMDTYEHSYARDYGIDKRGYVDAFFKNT